MPSWPRRLLLAASVALALACSYGPLLSAGFCGADYAALQRAGVDPERHADTSGLVPLWELNGSDLYRLEGEEGSLLAGLSLARSVRLWTRVPWERWSGIHPAAGYRAENLLLAIVGAIGLGLLVARLLRPWSGREHARAAARATALLFLVYPLGYSWIASLAGRGPLLGVAFGSWSVVAFLKGRQDRQFALSLVALLFSILAALATEFAIGLPFAFALAEYVSANRSRPRRERIRTSTTTLAVYGLAVGLVFMARAWHTGDPPLPGITGSVAVLDEGRWTRVALYAFEKLGVLILPANAHTLGFLGTALAGLLFLAALHPALRAARTAPRLWGWLLFIWTASLFIAQAPGMWRRVTPLDLSSARHLMLAALVMAMGLGIASTARSGVLRSVLPWLVAAGFVVLGRGNAEPWETASETVAELRQDLRRARALHGEAAAICVVDPPRVERGVEAVGEDLAAVLGERWDTEQELPLLVGLSEDAFRAFVREREFRELRDRPLVVLLPASALLPDSGEKRAGGASLDESVTPADELKNSVGATSARSNAASPAVDLAPARSGQPSAPTGRAMVVVSGPAEQRAGLTWSGNSRSPELELDPLQAGALRMVVGSAEDAQVEPRLSWSARGEHVTRGTARGVWLTAGADAEAAFDLSRELDWLLSARVRRLWFE